MTIDDLAAIEHQRVLGAEDRYGEFYIHAHNVSLFLSDFLLYPTTSVDVFLRWLSQIKKHHTLALFSVVRLHRVQANLCLRQTLESTVHATYSLAHPDTTNYYDPDAGILAPYQKGKDAALKWIREAWPLHSTQIDRLKKGINENTAHASILNSAHNFSVVPSDGSIITSFFDFENDDLIKSELWHVGQVGLIACDLIFATCQKHGGFLPKVGAEETLKDLIDQNGKLWGDLQPMMKKVAGE